MLEGKGKQHLKLGLSGGGGCLREAAVLVTLGPTVQRVSYACFKSIRWEFSKNLESRMYAKHCVEPLKSVNSYRTVKLSSATEGETV